LRLWLPKYNEHFGQLAEEVNNALLAISPATIDRILKPVRIQYQKRGKSTTKPGTLLRKQIPINTNQWDEFRPGFLKADTVANCGDSLQGMFVYTIDFVDIATGWTEQRACLGQRRKRRPGTNQRRRKMLPFPLLGFDSDNAHIEQKNWTHVRQWFGYQRLDNPKVVPLMNNLYRNEWRFFHNFFLPSVKLIEKERIGSKAIKKTRRH